MLTRRIGAAFDSAFVGEALLAFEEQLLAFAAALTALGVKITSHDLP
jgi:hypothetical protein